MEEKIVKNDLKQTIEQFFIRVNRGEASFADLINDLRTYQKVIKLKHYQKKLPNDVKYLKTECAKLMVDQDIIY
jgi:hypothetical protein